MPRHTHPVQHHGKERRPEAGRSHSHRKPPPPERGYEGMQLVRLSGRLAVLNVERAISAPTILGGAFEPPYPIPAPAIPAAPPVVPDRDVCKRHPNGPTEEPCKTCKKITRRAAPDRDVCRKHPQGDTGEPCHKCGEIRRRREAATETTRKETP